MDIKTKGQTLYQSKKRYKSSKKKRLVSQKIFSRTIAPEMSIFLTKRLRVIIVCFFKTNLKASCEDSVNSKIFNPLPRPKSYST